MIRSVAGQYRDIIAMFHISNPNAKLQQDVWVENVEIITKLGFQVVTLTVGNEINHKFFKQILMSNVKDSIENPFSISRPIFHGFDTVHLFKCF